MKKKQHWASFLPRIAGKARSPFHYWMKSIHSHYPPPSLGRTQFMGKCNFHEEDRSLKKHLHLLITNWGSMWVSTESSFPVKSWYLYPTQSDWEHFVPISRPEWLLAGVLGTLQAISQFYKHQCHLASCTPFVYLNKHRKNNIGHISLDWPYQWYFNDRPFGDTLQSSCQCSNSSVEARGADEGTWMSSVDPRSGDCV